MKHYKKKIIYSLYISKYIIVVRPHPGKPIVDKINFWQNNTINGLDENWNMREIFHTIELNYSELFK